MQEKARERENVVYALQRTQREAEGMITRMNVAQQRKEEDDLQSRKNRKAGVQRRQTKRRNSRHEAEDVTTEMNLALVCMSLPYDT